MPYCGRVHDTTDVPTEVEVVAPKDVREFVAAHGGRLFVWIRVPQGLVPLPCMLEAALRPPRRPELSFRRVGGPGFDLYLEATQRVWPKTMEFALRRRKRVEAYWNGMAWIA
jgi:hypothetical protein